MNDVTKLPKWAQQRITQLEGSVGWYKEKLRQVDEGDSEVWVQNYIDGDTALPKGTSVTFKIEGGEYTVSVRNGELELYAMGSRGHSTIAIIPQSSNVVKARLVEW